MERPWGDYIETDARAAWWRAWAAAHGGEAPRTLRTVQHWLHTGTVDFPSEPGSRGWAVTGLYDGSRVTRVESGLAALDACAVTVTTSKVAQAALARTALAARRAATSDCSSGSAVIPPRPGA